MGDTAPIQIDTINGQAAHIIHNHGPVYFVLERRTKPRPSPKTDQSQVLALMEYLPDRVAVLDFMGREFGTRMVVELDPKQLYRLRRYVEVILAAHGDER